MEFPKSSAGSFIDDMAGMRSLGIENEFFQSRRKPIVKSNQIKTKQDSIHPSSKFAPAKPQSTQIFFVCELWYESFSTYDFNLALTFASALAALAGRGAKTPVDARAAAE